MVTKIDARKALQKDSKHLWQLSYIAADLAINSQQRV